MKQHDAAQLERYRTKLGDQPILGLCRSWAGDTFSRHAAVGPTVLGEPLGEGFDHICASGQAHDEEDHGRGAA